MTCRCPTGWCYQRYDCRKGVPRRINLTSDHDPKDRVYDPTLPPSPTRVRVLGTEWLHKRRGEIIAEMADVGDGWTDRQRQNMQAALDAIEAAIKRSTSQ
jgi:hypothetical protein